jgi:uncharacterized membrane protein YfcA
MIYETLLPVLAVIVIATYFQTVTGFGLGMIVMGVSSGLALAAAPLVATVLSLVTLVNCATALPGKLHHIDRPAMRAVLLGIAPGVIVGVLLLDYLNATASTALQFLLGVVIMTSGVLFTVRRKHQAKRSGNGSFFFSGLLSGLMGGLFGVAGPPVIFQYYRQPMEMVAVRSSLIMVFGVSSTIRAVLVATQGGLTMMVWWLAGGALVLGALATVAGRRYPPPLKHAAMQRIGFGALIVIGAGLIVTATRAALVKL